MFCESCRSLLDPGSVACRTCGREVPDVKDSRGAPNRIQELREPSPLATDTRSQCGAHPGMPLVGNCPRCSKRVCIRCAPDAALDVFTCTDCMGLSAMHRTAPAGAACALHPESKAAFICARCGSFGCSFCAHPSSAGWCIRCSPASQPLAGLGARLAAHLIDHFVLFVPMLGAFILIALGNKAGDLRGFEVGLFFWMIIAVFGGFAVQLVAQVHWGQSVGKRLFAIKVVRTDGQPIELWRLIFLRNVVLNVAGQLCGLIGLVDALFIFGNERRCIHDYLADSIVVDSPR